MKLTLTIGGVVNLNNFSNIDIDLSMETEVLGSVLESDQESYLRKIVALMRQDLLVNLGVTYHELLKGMPQESLVTVRSHPPRSQRFNCRSTGRRFASLCQSQYARNRCPRSRGSRGVRRRTVKLT